MWERVKSMDDKYFSSFSFCHHVFKLLYLHLKGVSKKELMFSKSSAGDVLYVGKG